jgi:hypothetical protein
MISIKLQHPPYFCSLHIYRTCNVSYEILWVRCSYDMWCSSVSGYQPLQLNVKLVILYFTCVRPDRITFWSRNGLGLEVSTSVFILLVFRASWWKWNPRLIACLIESPPSRTCSCHFSVPCNPWYLFAVAVTLFLCVSHIFCYVSAAWLLHVARTKLIALCH